MMTHSVEIELIRGVFLNDEPCILTVCPSLLKSMTLMLYNWEYVIEVQGLLHCESDAFKANKSFSLIIYFFLL